MSGNYPSIKRRTVLSAAGVGILGSITSGSGAATADVSSDSEENPVDLQPIEGHVVATHIETDEEYVFESSGEIDTTNLPAGEYRIEHHQQTPESVVVDTEHVTLGDTVEVASDEATLETEIDDNRGIDPEGSLRLWVSATTGSHEDVSGVSDATIEFEITDNNNEVVVEDSTTTEDNGFAFHEIDLDLEDGGYSLDIEWTEEELTSFHSFETGSLVDIGWLSGPVGPDEEVGVPVSRTLEHDPDPVTTELELERPDDSTETVSVDINDGGVGIAEFVPEETGSYRLTPPDGFGTTIDVQNQRFYTESFRIRDQLVDEPIVYGGFILDDEVQPLGNESVEVELRERFGDEVYETIETTTDADGRLLVEFESLSEADSYTVAVTSDDGEEINADRIRLHEIEEDEDELEPELSVSIDEFRAPPGEEITATIDLTDEAGVPVEGDVTVVERIGFNGPILAIDSVSTDEQGTTEYETSVPGTFIEGERFYVDGIATVDDENVEDNDDSRVESADVNLSFGDVVPGSSVEQELTITNRATDEPVTGADVGMVFSRNHNSRGGALEAGSGTTDADGSIDFEFGVPADAREMVGFSPLYRPYEQISTRFSLPFSTFSPSVDTPNEVPPGDTFEVSYTVEDSDADTAGILFVEKTDEAQVEILDPDESVVVDIPTRMAGDRVSMRTVIIDTDGHIVTEFDSVSVAEDEEDEEDEELVDAPGGVEIPAKYVNEQDEVGPTEVLDAGTDFQSGEIGPTTLLDVGTAFQAS